MAPKQGAKQTSGGKGKPKIGHQRPCATLNAASVPNPPVLRGVQLYGRADREQAWAPLGDGRAYRYRQETLNAATVP